MLRYRIHRDQKQERMSRAVDRIQPYVPTTPGTSTHTHIHIYTYILGYSYLGRYFVFFFSLPRFSYAPLLPTPLHPALDLQILGRLHLRPGLLSACFLFWSVWPPPTADLGCHTPLCLYPRRNKNTRNSQKRAGECVANEDTHKDPLTECSLGPDLNREWP